MIPPASDFWQVGLVPAPIGSLLEPAVLRAFRDRTVWLPDPGAWRYLADPFGLQRGDTTHVFVEAFDYRTKHAVIEHHEFGAGLVWRNKAVVLARPFHLSYPYIVEDGGEIFMIPESHRAGEIALYRAREFPRQWIRETVLLPGVPGAEASLLKHEGHWWMFFTIVGPWRLHPQNPIIDNRAGARPGGTPFIGPDGRVTLPVQDCSRTYGGAIRFVRFTALSPDRITFEHGSTQLTGEMISSSHQAGCHTLAQCGNLTLIDTKRIARSWGRYAIDLRRRVARMGRSAAGGPA